MVQSAVERSTINFTAYQRRLVLTTGGAARMAYKEEFDVQNYQMNRCLCIYKILHFSLYEESYAKNRMPCLR